MNGGTGDRDSTTAEDLDQASPAAAPGISVAQYVRMPLGTFGSVQQLEAAARRVIRTPLPELLDEIEDELGHLHLDVEGQRRLHLLVSFMYHQMSAVDERLVDQLRADVSDAHRSSQARRAAAPKHAP